MTNGSGTSPTSSADQFGYLNSTGPAVTSVTPSAGGTAGGSSVAINGANFTGATAVKFGTTNATSYTVNSASQITAVVPSGSAGTDDVTVAVPVIDKTTDVYDTDGEQVCEASPNAAVAGISCPAPGGSRVGGTTTTSYNSDGEVTAVTDPDGNLTSTTYDGDGNVATVTDGLSNVMKTTYDLDDRVASVTQGYGTSAATTQYTTYDIVPASCPSAPAGTTYCTQSQDGMSNVTTSYYNALDQLIEQAPPNTTAQSVATYTYDAAGNVLSKADGSGTATYGYDADNRLTGITYSNTPSGMTQPHAVTYSYDSDGNRDQMTDGTGTTTYAYDPFERLDSVTNGDSQVVTYGYDEDGNRTCVSYPNSGSTSCLNASSGTGLVTYGYDSASELTSMSDWLGNTTSFAYDNNGNLVGSTLPTGTNTSISDTFDASDALTDTSMTTTSTSQNLASTSRNADENIATDASSGGAPTTYSYDPLNRVTTGTTSTYAYNADSELTTTTPSGGSATDYTYNSDGQLCWSASSTGSCGSPPSGATTFSYNNAGDRVSSTPSGGNATTEGWDQAGDLVCETAPNTSGYSCASPNSSVTSTYAYNGDGLRTSDVPAGGSNQQFAWDVNSSAPSVLEDGTNFYLYGPTVGAAPLEQISVSGSTPSWLVSDETGVREQISSSGSIVGSMSYDSFGNPCGGCTISTPFGFEGGYRDASGLSYLIHRYYDPATGQFLTVDPLVDETEQPYAYTDDDPVNAIDPNGLDCGLFSFACSAYDSAAGGVKTAAKDTGHFVAEHHQVIEQVATVGGAIIGMAACDAATAGACSAFTPYVGALVGTAVYAEGGGQHTAEGYALAFASGGLVGSLSMVWGGVVTAGVGLWAGDSAIGAGEGIYDYATGPGCQTFGGYLKAGITGASENAPIKLHWLFGQGEE